MPRVVLFLILANVAVFSAWLVLGDQPVMTDNFLVSWDALVAGRYWTLLGSAFSHIGVLHIFLNMYVLLSFGSVVEQILGSGRFLAFYLVAGIVGSLGHAVVSAFLLGQPALPALGASGAVSGVVILFSLMLPGARLLLFGLIPMPAIVGAMLFVGIDLLGLFAQTGGGGLPIGHGAHLAGAMTGALAYLVLRHSLPRPLGARLNYTDVEAWNALVRQARIDRRL